MINGVPEREEGIRGDGNTIKTLQEAALLLCRQGLWRRIKVLQPLSSLCILHVTLNVAHSCVHTVLSLHTILEWQAFDLWMKPQPPGGHLSASKLHTVHTALLTGTNTNHHAILAVANGVGLRVFDGNGCQNEVFLCLVWQSLLRGHYFRQLGRIEQRIVSFLHEADAANHSIFQVGVLKFRVSLEDDELAALLGLQNFQSFWNKGRSNDAIADFDLQNHRSGHIHLVGNCNEVSKGAHGISISRADISCGRCCQLLVLDFVDKSLLIAQWDANCCAGRTDMLERGSSWQASCLCKLMNKLPCIDCIQKIDVTWRSIHNIKGKLLPTNCTQACWQLMRVASILQRHFQLECHCFPRRRLCDLSR
mmetsp:Transcript_28290/g.34571  ORF Transcript_28290/g.34571 Transcript_28290/m.34571 type:complete len:364 (-) Transcript_28290:663-1754(-)